MSWTTLASCGGATGSRTGAKWCEFAAQQSGFFSTPWRCAGLALRLLNTPRLLATEATTKQVPDDLCIAQDERGEQLKNMTNLSALMAGFAMASFLQFNFDDSRVSTGVLFCFGLTTSVVVRTAAQGQSWLVHSLEKCLIMAVFIPSACVMHFSQCSTRSVSFKFTKSVLHALVALHRYAALNRNRCACLLCRQRFAQWPCRCACCCWLSASAWLQRTSRTRKRRTSYCSAETSPTGAAFVQSCLLPARPFVLSRWTVTQGASRVLLQSGHSDIWQWRKQFLENG